MNTCTAFLLLILKLLFGTDELTEPSKATCEKCDIARLAKTEAQLGDLSREEIETFFCTIENSCKVNVEFSEYLSEVLFMVLAEEPKLSITCLSAMNESKLQLILEELKNPHESVDLNKLYSKITSVKGHHRIRKRVLTSLQIARNKSGPHPNPLVKSRK